MRCWGYLITVYYGPSTISSMLYHCVVPWCGPLVTCWGSHAHTIRYSMLLLVLTVCSCYMVLYTLMQTSTVYYYTIVLLVLLVDLVCIDSDGVYPAISPIEYMLLVLLLVTTVALTHGVADTSHVCYWSMVWCRVYMESMCYAQQVSNLLHVLMVSLVSSCTVSITLCTP